MTASIGADMLDEEIDWAAEYAAARERTIAFARSLPSQAADVRVPACPAWTVRNVLAHVTGVSVALAGENRPQGDAQAWIDGLVAERAGRSLPSLAEEWADAAGGTEAFLLGIGRGGHQLVYDVVSHEHDIRNALGMPGERDSSGVHACLLALSIRFERQLRAQELPAIELTSDGRTWRVGEGEPGLAIELDPFELVRVFVPRRSESQLRALPWHGDLDRYLPAIAHFPLPEHDIVE
jgi:uncharacterized protein (TIGR03083 family)